MSDGEGRRAEGRERERERERERAREAERDRESKRQSTKKKTNNLWDLDSSLENSINSKTMLLEGA
jgi:hypothetical protein